MTAPTLQSLGWFRPREFRALASEGINTLGALVRRSEMDLMRVPRLGVLSVLRIRQALAAHDIALAGEPLDLTVAARQPKKKARPARRAKARTPRRTAPKDEALPADHRHLRGCMRLFSCNYCGQRAPRVGSRQVDDVGLCCAPCVDEINDAALLTQPAPCVAAEPVAPPVVSAGLSAGFDPRFQLPPGARIKGGFADMGIGRYLD